MALASLAKLMAADLLSYTDFAAEGQFDGLILQMVVRVRRTVYSSLWQGGQEGF